MLALVAGSAVLATESARDHAQDRAAAHTIKTLHQTIKTFTAIRGSAPDDLDSLTAVNATGCDTANVCGVTGSAELLASLHPSLAASLFTTTLSTNALNALVAAGITRLRYVDDQGNLLKPNCTGGAGCSVSVVAMNGATPVLVGNLDETDVPNRVFDTPANSGENRGRGFDHSLEAGDPVAAVTDAALLAKVGAASGDVLLAFGLGDQSTLVAPATTGGGVALAAAPTSPSVKKQHYARFVALYNVGSSSSPNPRALLQAVLDADGAVLDEKLDDNL
jgi:hypothetical protein